MRSFLGSAGAGGSAACPTNAPAATRYCLDATVNNKTSHVVRPAVNPAAADGTEAKGDVVTGACPAAIAN